MLSGNVWHLKTDCTSAIGLLNQDERVTLNSLTSQINWTSSISSTFQKMLEAAAAAVQENLISAYLMSSSTSRAAKTMSQMIRSVFSACSAAREQTTKTAPSHSEWTSMLRFLPRPAISQARGHSANFFEISPIGFKPEQDSTMFGFVDFEAGGKHFITDTLWNVLQSSSIRFKFETIL